MAENASPPRKSGFRLIDRLFGRSQPSAPAPFTPFHAEDAEKVAEQIAREQLSRQATADATLPPGERFDVNFDPVREHYGERWKRLSGRASLLAERVLKRRLEDRVTFIHTETGVVFVINDDELTEDQVHQLGENIAADILRELMGGDDVARLSFEHPEDAEAAAAAAAAQANPEDLDEDTAQKAETAPEAEPKRARYAPDPVDEEPDFASGWDFSEGPLSTVDVPTADEAASDSAARSGESQTRAEDDLAIPVSGQLPSDDLAIPTADEITGMEVGTILSGDREEDEYDTPTAGERVDAPRDFGTSSDRAVDAAETPTAEDLELGLWNAALSDTLPETETETPVSGDRPVETPAVPLSTTKPADELESPLSDDRETAETDVAISGVRADGTSDFGTSESIPEAAVTIADSGERLEQEFEIPASATRADAEIGVPTAETRADQEFPTALSEDRPDAQAETPLSQDRAEAEAGVPVSGDRLDPAFAVPTSEDRQALPFAVPTAADRLETVAGIPVSGDRRKRNVDVGPFGERAEDKLALALSSDRAASDHGVPTSADRPEREFAVPISADRPEQDLPVPTSSDRVEATLAVPQSQDRAEAEIAVPHSDDRVEKDHPVGESRDRVEREVHYAATKPAEQNVESSAVRLSGGAIFRVRLRYGALLDIATGVVTTYLADPAERRADETETVFNHLMSLDLPAEHAFAIDCLALDLTRKQVPTVRAEGGRFLLGLPVSASTLLRPKLRGPYLHRLAEMPPAERQMTRPMVYGIGQTSPTQLAEILGWLRGVARTPILRLPPEPELIGTLVQEGAYAALYDATKWSRRMGEAIFHDRMHRIQRIGHAAKLRVGIFNPSDRRDIAHAIDSGMDYVQVAILGTTAEIPRRVVRLDRKALGLKPPQPPVPSSPSVAERTVEPV